MEDICDCHGARGPAMAQHTDKASHPFHAKHSSDLIPSSGTIQSLQISHKAASHELHAEPDTSCIAHLAEVVFKQRSDTSAASGLLWEDEALLDEENCYNVQGSTDKIMDKARQHSSKHNKRATRRGPMDEMRQLVRILVKIIPQSSKNVRNCDEGGGGNRISEDQIKHYLAATLGDAPQPKWGVPEGWSSYLAELFSWVTSRNIRCDEAARCAKREPGRSWEAIDSELANLGILPSTWPLPLSKDSMGSALVPATQFHASPSSSAQRSGSAKRSADHSMDLLEGNGKRTRSETLVNGPYGGTNEVEAWQSALNAVNLAISKAGSSDSLEQQMTVARLKAEILSKVQVPSVVPQPALLLGAQAAPQLVPITVPGPDGHAQTAFTIQMQQLPLAPTSSLDLSSSLTGGNAQQPLRNQLGGSGAFQAVRPSSTDCATALQSSVLSQPPPLQLLQKNNSLSTDSEPDSPFSDEAISSTFNSSSLPWNASVSSPTHLPNLFKPTAVKKETSATCPPYPLDGGKPCHEMAKSSTALASLQNAAQLLSMSSSPTFCGQLQQFLQLQSKMLPILPSQPVGKTF